MIRALAILIAAATLAAPATAQTRPPAELKVGVPAKGLASAKPVADVYFLVGEAGAKETYSFTGKGPASITLFGPDGSEILTASGSGTVKLEVVLPFTDVFTIAVARKTPAQPYALARETTVPTLAEAQLAVNAGYEIKGNNYWSCWVIPGVKLKLHDPEGLFREDALAADRTTIKWTAINLSGTAQGDRTYWFDGSLLHRIRRNQDGKVTETTSELELSYSPDKIGGFRGYLCKD